CDHWDMNRDIAPSSIRDRVCHSASRPCCREKVKPHWYASKSEERCNQREPQAWLLNYASLSVRLNHSREDKHCRQDNCILLSRDRSIQEKDRICRRRHSHRVCLPCNTRACGKEC